MEIPAVVKEYFPDDSPSASPPLPAGVSAPEADRYCKVDFWKIEVRRRANAGNAARAHVELGP